MFTLKTISNYFLPTFSFKAQSTWANFFRLDLFKFASSIIKFQLRSLFWHKDFLRTDGTFINTWFSVCSNGNLRQDIPHELAETSDVASVGLFEYFESWSNNFLDELLIKT